MERRLHKMKITRRKRRIMMYNLISFISIIIILIVMAFSFLTSNPSIIPAATPAPTYYFN